MVNLLISSSISFLIPPLQFQVEILFVKNILLVNDVLMSKLEDVSCYEIIFILFIIISAEFHATIRKELWGDAVKECRIKIDIIGFCFIFFRIKWIRFIFAQLYYF